MPQPPTKPETPAESRFVLDVYARLAAPRLMQHANAHDLDSLDLPKEAELAKVALTVAKSEGLIVEPSPQPA